MISNRHAHVIVNGWLLARVFLQPTKRIRAFCKKKSGRTIVVVSLLGVERVCKLLQSFFSQVLQP